MSLENYTGYIPSLVPSNPTPTDPKSEGDDHLRGIKDTLAKTFVGFTEPAQGVTVTATQINEIAGLGTAFLVPTGGVMMFGSDNVPFGFLRCNGAAVSRTTYQRLFNQIGTIWGAGDGSTTFNVPDFQGYFPRGVNPNATGPDPDRALASDQEHAFMQHNHNVNLGGGSHTHTAVNAGAHSHTVSAATNTASTTSSGGSATTFSTQTLTSSSAGDHTHTINASTHSHSGFSDGAGGFFSLEETRPINKAIHFIIKY